MFQSEKIYNGESVTRVFEDQRNTISEKVNRDWKQEEALPVLKPEGHVKE